MTKGVDRAAPFTAAELKILADHGYTFVGRYFSASSWKVVTRSEALRIKDAGLYLVTVYQDANNSPIKFTAANAAKHAANAIKQAKAIRQPSGTPIYFAVDYDVQGAGGYPGLLSYFQTLVKAFKGSGYSVGVYGGYAAVNYVKRQVPSVTHIWQTVAWSRGERADYNLLQSKVDVPLPEAPKSIKNVDILESNGNGGGFKVEA
jgi:hypothetical protein